MNSISVTTRNSPAIQTVGCSSVVVNETLLPHVSFAQCAKRYGSVCLSVAL